MKQPQELTKRTLLGLQKDQLIDHILDLQRYIRYSTGTTFYANHVHETPYGSIYSQTLTAAHKLLGRLQNIPSHSDRVRSKVNAIHQNVTDHGKGRASQIALLATNSPKKSRARKPHRPTATNAKSATFHARKRTSYRKTIHAEKSVVKSEDGRIIYIYLTPKLIQNIDLVSKTLSLSNWGYSGMMDDSVGIEEGHQTLPIVTIVEHYEFLNDLLKDQKCEGNGFQSADELSRTLEDLWIAIKKDSRGNTHESKALPKQVDIDDFFDLLHLLINKCHNAT